MSQIVLIIPAYEPDERMSELLVALRKIYSGNIIIVNDGSSTEYDYLYEKAVSQGCVVLKHHKNMGKGRSLKDAFNYCLNEFPDLLGCVTADSDGQHKPEDILRCMDELKEYSSSLILGCRNFNTVNIPYKSKFGNNLTKRVCKFICGLNISDTQTGLRGIPKSFMEELLNTTGERFEFETRMLIESKEHYPIHEIEIETIYDSKEKHQTHFDPVKDSLRIYKIFGEILFRFLFSSLSSSVIDLWLFHLFSIIFKRYITLYLSIATILARIISATYNYTINYKYVFESKEKHQKSAKKYIVLAIFQMLCSAFFVTLGCKYLWFLPELLVKIIVDVILFFLSFTIQREIVF